MAVHDPLTNPIGLKALAWSYEDGCFVSPWAADFKWNEAGLQASGCQKLDKSSNPFAMAEALQHKKIPDENCTCGLYTAYAFSLAYEYTYRGIVSPVFIMETSGKTIFHSLGFRSEELLIRAVVRKIGTNAEDVMKYNLVVKQAARYFDIPILGEGAAEKTVDLWNTFHPELHEQKVYMHNRHAAKYNGGEYVYESRWEWKQEEYNELVESVAEVFGYGEHKENQSVYRRLFDPPRG